MGKSAFVIAVNVDDQKATALSQYQILDNPDVKIYFSEREAAQERHLYV